MCLNASCCDSQRRTAILHAPQSSAGNEQTGTYLGIRQV